MAALADHSSAMHDAYPEDHLLVICDFDSLALNSGKIREGILETMRWFQIQPRTSVGCYTKRNPNSRHRMLRQLRNAGRRFRLDTGEIPFLCGQEDREPEERIQEAKKYFNARGYRTIAAMTGDSDISSPYVTGDDSDELLTMHLGTESRIRTEHYYRISLSHLMREEALPTSIRLCWHGLNDHANLQQFIQSDILWGELDIRTGPDAGRLIARHDSFKKSPLKEGERLLPAEECLERFRREDRNAKVDFKEGGEVVHRTLELLQQMEFGDDQLWFHANTRTLSKPEFQRIAELYPGAILQTTVDHLSPLILTTPKIARSKLNQLRSWGINQYLLSWRIRRKVELLDRLQKWDHRVNLYQIPDLEEFLRAVLLMPDAITTDFNFPDWNYFGRGSGEDMIWHSYAG